MATFQCGEWLQHYLTMLGATVIIPTLLVPAMGGDDDDKAQTIQRCSPCMNPTAPGRPV